MKDLIERVRSFNRPANEQHVAKIVEYLGESPSLKTLEAVLKFYKDEEKAILTKDLLDWMHEHDQMSFETDDVKVSIRTNVNAKVLNPDLAFKWLEERDYGDLIKDTVEFGKGEFDPQLEAFLNEKGYSYTQKQGIHPQTLKKVMKDRLADGEDLPTDIDPENPEDFGDGFKVGYFDECVVKEK